MARKTFLEMQNETYAALRDSERAFFDIDDVKAWLNEAYLDIAARLRLPEDTVTGTTDEDGLISYPSSLLVPRRLIVDEELMTWVTSDVFLSHQLAGTGESMFRIWDDVIETYPVADTMDYTLEFISRPTEMSGDSDTASDIPGELDPRLVFYARATAKLIEGELNEYNIWFDRYERGLPGPPRPLARSMPGPLALIPESNPLW